MFDIDGTVSEQGERLYVLHWEPVESDGLSLVSQRDKAANNVCLGSQYKA
jgi:hypothetical protein